MKIYNSKKMKLKNSISLLFMIMIIMLSCKKSEVKNDTVDNTNNLAEELKGSIWAGEFRYTTGYQGLQPFSLILNNGGTLTWSDIQNTRAAGTWAVEGNKITIKAPNGSSFSADVTKESWSNFTKVADNGFEIINISPSDIPTYQSLENTKWTGKCTIEGLGNSYDAIISFLPDNIIATSINSGIPFKEKYSIEGAGIRSSLNLYFIFLNKNTIVKGFNFNNVIYDAVFSWNLTKQ